jgi:hypothetical protein
MNDRSHERNIDEIGGNWDWHFVRTVFTVFMVSVLVVCDSGVSQAAEPQADTW